ncbi:hypothetical protein JMJ55_00860 [Belnapia sp. T6]|uniref:Uncharacterized protein n=1 Tax=Belnapia mucosa TaxID=2804532 RepID=A0ABS1UWK3_9PROT|nr:hypothetical protein [Belnapia mucosa]MBL6453850.1 hypothetical protein [Belnapia mucosa]
MQGHDVRPAESAAVDPHAPEPVPPETAEIPWHCPSFDPSLEARFLAEGERVWLRITRNWLILTAGLGALMAWAAPLSGRDTLLAALGLQGVLGLSAALLAAHWLPRLPAGRVREVVFGLAAIIVLGCAALVGWWASEAYANRYVMAAAFR